MRGLAIATLFLGMALIDPGADVDARACMALAATASRGSAGSVPV
jgi:hypothetical protein